MTRWRNVVTIDFKYRAGVWKSAEVLGRRRWWRIRRRYLYTLTCYACGLKPGWALFWRLDDAWRALEEHIAPHRDGGAS